MLIKLLKSFKLVMQVDPRHHPKIIGRRGAVVSKIRDEYDVNIQFPDKGTENVDEITIIGYEDKAKAAQEEIQRIVTELVSARLCTRNTLAVNVHPSREIPLVQMYEF